MEEKNSHFVYMLECKDGSLYTGYTNDLERRIAMHQTGKGAKYTRGRGPFKIVYCQQFATKIEAMQNEYKIKKMKRNAKLNLINSYQEGQDGNE